MSVRFLELDETLGMTQITVETAVKKRGGRLCTRRAQRELGGSNTRATADTYIHDTKTQHASQGFLLFYSH